MIIEEDESAVDDVDNQAEDHILLPVEQPTKNEQAVEPAKRQLGLGIHDIDEDDADDPACCAGYVREIYEYLYQRQVLR